MSNTQNLFENYDFNPMIEKLMKNFNIPSDDNHYGRHLAEVKKKIEEFKKNAKTKGYFNDMPNLNTDFSSYVISKSVYNRSVKYPICRKGKTRKIQNIYE
jgi:hypothetical protein